MKTADFRSWQGAKRSNIAPGASILRWLLMTLLIASMPARSASLDDPRVAAELEAGRAQGVVVQFRELPATARTLRDARAVVANRVLARLPESRFVVRRSYRELPMRALTLHDSAALAQLLADPDVEAVFADKPLHAHLLQSLPQIGQSDVVDIMGRQGAGSAIAVIDTGVDYTQSELGRCSAPGAGGACRVVAAYEAAPDDGAADANGHGTKVALTAAATAPQADIVAIDVFDDATALSSDIIDGIDWAIANRSAYNIVAINMSLGDGVEHGTPCSNRFLDPFVTPVRNARNAGIVVVASSGNDGFTAGIASPACVGEAVSVGAVYDRTGGQVAWSGCTDASTTVDQVTCFSNSGAPLDLLAPGAMITVGGSTVGGTSFSAPFVSGAVAVLKAQFPAETPAQIEARIVNGGVPVIDGRNALVRPRLDLLTAQGAPDNDDFAAAAALTGTAGSASGWNFNATAQNGEPLHASATGATSVWWTWSAPADGSLAVDTAGSALDTLLGVYQGVAVSALTEVGSDDDGGSEGTSALSIDVYAGEVYRIAVDGKNGAQGALALTYAYTVAPPKADVAVTLSAAPDAVAVGDAVTLTATVSNGGPQGGADVLLTVTLPAELTFVGAPTGCTHAASVVDCVVGTLAIGAVQEVVVSTRAVTAGRVQTAAAVGSATTDPVVSNNTASVDTSIAIVGAADDADVPLPAWALWALGMALLAGARRGR
ncbi:S8 family serine peptidase [Denitromonas iodatirespirans]|uniref:S8 family serine peptidase n=1 Tax=Denitromonas iodatirespirans TaxID=2795389 RepID=A0A944HBF8_DENI1|nr:S8 family serine peptidase [Denitromonas iodatirespirans]MBT0960251.1 S8 family serine peptidase [Denitromonas iodatirespirans]